MTRLTRPVRRTVPRGGRPLVVMLIPASERGPAEIELRESRRRVGYRISVQQLYTMLARRAAGLPGPMGRRERRVS